MKIIERVIEYTSRSDEFDIHVITDIHDGDKASDTPRLERRLDEINKDPFALWVDLGDNCAFINMRDPRVSFGSLPRWLVIALNDNPKSGLAQLQRDHLARLINERETLGSKLLAWVEGNHESSIHKHSEIDVYLSLLEKIRPNTKQALAVGLSGFLVLRFRRMKKNGGYSTFSVVIYMHHGWGGGDLAGGVNLKLERQMDRIEADVYLMGHHHKVTTHTNAGQMRVNEGLQLEQGADKVGAICGTYLRTVINDADTWAEGKSFRAAPSTSDIIVRIRPDKKEIDMVQRTVRESAILEAVEGS